IPPPFNWVTQLVYMDTWVPVPVAMSPFFMPLLTPNFQIRTNSDRLVMQPLELVLAFQVLVLGDFVPPVVTQFLDYRTVDPPPFLVAPGFPQQTPVIPAQGQRPPEIINMGISGPIIDFVDFFQVSLAPNNGNGWVYVNVSDSSPVPNVTEYWLYLAESILP
ncbi:MAG: hypothetical protein NZ576_12765, partial [Bacteroidia bacterium]|nr:hypothetical protein [Bacteroidia bacterium]